MTGPARPAAFSSQNALFLKSAPVAQLDRANASGALGREFESLRAHHLLNRIMRPRSRLRHSLGWYTESSAMRRGAPECVRLRNLLKDLELFHGTNLRYL